MFTADCVVIVIAGCGKTGPDPSADITLEDGMIVPVGKGSNTSVANSNLLYNEYPFGNRKNECFLLVNLYSDFL